MSTDQPLEMAQNNSDHVKSYIGGLVLSILLTAASYTSARSHLVWSPSVPVLLAVLAIAQMGVHLAFFLHISSAPDSTNTILALAFGVFVAGLIVFGSIFIMTHLSANMVPMDKLLQMQR